MKVKDPIGDAYTVFLPWPDYRPEIKQVKSGSGQTARMNANLEAIGLRHHQHSVVKQDSPSLRGMIKRVRHLVTVTPVKE